MSSTYEEKKERAAWWVRFGRDAEYARRGRKKRQTHWARDKARLYMRIVRGLNLLMQRRCKWCREVIECRASFCGEWCRENWACRKHTRPKPPAGWEFVQHAATAAGVQRGTIKRWLKAGLPSDERGGHRIIHIPTLLDWKAKLPKFGRGRQRYFPPPLVDDPLEAGVVYALCDPRNGAVRYIGKARNLRKRLYQYRCRQHTQYLRNWFALLKNKGLEPTVKVLEECLFGLCDAERKWIAHGRRRGWKLINMSEGGGSVPKQPASLLSERSKRAWADPAHRGKMVEATRRSAARRMGLTLEEWQALPRTPSGAIIKPPKPPKPKALRLTKCMQEQQQRAAERALMQTLTVLTHKGTAFVPLTRGMWAAIDAEDWPKAKGQRWYAQRHNDAYRAVANKVGRGKLFLRGVVTERRGALIQYPNVIECRLRSARRSYVIAA